jgi:hypothetical protein
VRHRWLSRTYREKCPDGTTVTVHRSVDDLFPLEVKASKSSYLARMQDGTGMVSAEVKAENRTFVTNVLFDIDKKNNTYMLKQRSAYASYMTNPCARSADYAAEVRSLNEMHDRLMAFEQQASVLISMLERGVDLRVVVQLYCEAASGIGPVNPVLGSLSARFNMQNAREDIGKWIGADPSAGEGELP